VFSAEGFGANGHLVGSAALLLARAAFHGDKHRYQRQHKYADAQRAAQIVQPAPAAEDARGKGAHPEVFHGAVVVEGLHGQQQRTTGNGRPRQGQCDAAEAAWRGGPQHAGGIQLAAHALGERGARGQVDVGEEHQRQHHGKSGQAHDIGPETQVRFGPAGQFASGTQQRRVGVCAYVGGQREGHHQGPAEEAAARKAELRNEPGRWHRDAECNYEHGGKE
jgi:hypothetical protein